MSASRLKNGPLINDIGPIPEFQWVDNIPLTDFHFPIHKLHTCDAKIKKNFWIKVGWFDLCRLTHCFPLELLVLTMIERAPRVAKSHGCGGYIRVKKLEGWGKKSGRIHSFSKSSIVLGKFQTTNMKFCLQTRII